MTVRSLRRYTTLPDLPSRGPLSTFVGVIIPLARTNLITNPSFELGATTGWAARGGATFLVVSSAEQYHGVYSLSVTPGGGTSDGVRYAINLTSGTIYAASVKIKGQAGVPYQLAVTDTSDVIIATSTFIGTGRWQWRSLIYRETSTTTRRIAVAKNGSTSTTIFYVDGAQLEAITDGVLAPTTYIDGDQQGLLVGQQPPAYVWNGTPHASTSTRSALTRAGGYVMDIRKAYGFLLTSIVGLGMAVPNNVSVPYTVLDGARYQRTTKPPRTLAFAGRFQANTVAQLDRLRSDMRAALDRDLIPIQQPLVLMVEPRDECDNPTGDFATVQCVYAGGLEGNDTNLPLEDAAPAFTMYVPFLLGGDAAATLSALQNVSNANTVLQRSSAGTWSAMGTGMTHGVSAYVNAMVRGLDGTIYAGGRFTDAGGSGADMLAKWNGSSWAVVRTAAALNSDVNALAVGPDGKIYVGGLFTNADGNANADAIAVYDPVADTYAALSTGITGGGAVVYALAFDRAGNLYAAGDFTTAGGVACARIAKWNGSAWSALSTGLNNTGFALATDAANRVYVGGSFTTAGGTTVNGVARWNGSAFASLAGGVSGGSASVLALAIGVDGRPYAGGNFTAAGGVSAANIARWNGTSWTPLGSGTNNSVTSLAVAPGGNIYVGGSFSTAGGLTLPDDFAIWNGSAWIPPDVNLPTTSAQVNAVLPAPDDTLYLGFNTSGTAEAPTITSVTNSTPGYVWPVLVITGPVGSAARLYQIVNRTTRVGIWLNNLIISGGETMTLNTDPANFSFTSTFQGDLTSAILPGSQPALFYLAPGANNISFYANSSSVTATLRWKKRYNGSADLVN